MKNTKRILSLCLVAVMMLTLALPAMAAGGNITQIGGYFSQQGNQANNTNTSNTHTIYIADSKNGLISSDKQATSEKEAIVVEAGADQTVYIIAAAGYEVVDVKIDGKSVGAVTEYTFEKVMKDHNIEAKFAKIGDTVVEDTEEEGLPFTDVAKDDWFYDAVEYVYGKGLMIGNNAEGTLFDPDVILNRAMLATVLYRIEGQPEVEFKGAFDDVPEGEWYSAPVEWAADLEIVLGFGDGNFKPTDELTREQAMAMLNRYAAYKGYKTSANEDVSEAIISDWAVENVEWAVEYGIIYLGEEGEIAGFDATADISRAEMAYALAQFSAEYID